MRHSRLNPTFLKSFSNSKERRNKTKNLTLRDQERSKKKLQKEISGFSLTSKFFLQIVFIKNLIKFFFIYTCKVSATKIDTAKENL